jgi:hypothetical protein
VAWGRFIWAAPLAIVGSIAVNALLRTLSKALFNVPDEFMPFTPGSFVFLTTAGTLGGVLVFALLGWLTRRPFRIFNWVAAVVLVPSWIPDILLLIGRPFPGISIASVGTLMLMHAAAAGITVGLLNTQARAR